MPSKPLNKVELTGTVGRVDFKPVSSGHFVANISIAQNREYKGKKNTLWFPITAWGDRAKWASQNLTPGMLVKVVGSIQENKYTNKKGIDINTLKITAWEIDIIAGKEKKKAEEKPQETRTASEGVSVGYEKPSIEEQAENEDDTIPF